MISQCWRANLRLPSLRIIIHLKINSINLRRMNSNNIILFEIMIPYCSIRLKGFMLFLFRSCQGQAYILVFFVVLCIFISVLLSYIREQVSKCPTQPTMPCHVTCIWVEELDVFKKLIFLMQLASKPFFFAYLCALTKIG